MKLIFTLLLFCATTISSLPLSAQPYQLKNVHDPLLAKLIKEKKPVHFEIQQTAEGPVVLFGRQEQNVATQKQDAIFTDAGKSSAAGNFHLTKDINAQTDANPANQNQLYKDSFAILNDIMYFAANDGIHGSELWRSDGTAAGTYLVKDIEAGGASSTPQEIIAVKNKLYFITQSSSTFSNKLWISDGTDAGTTELEDLGLSGPGVNGRHYLTDAGNAVYFLTGSPYSTQVWKTNGTAGGTVFIKDLSAEGNTPVLSAATNGIYYFTFYSYTYGRELWRSDGTYAGTYLLKDISDTSDFFYGPFQLTSFNNQLYFSADDGGGRKLWQTDGTNAGTQKVNGSGTLVLSTNYLFEFVNVPFAVLNNQLYFGATKPLTGSELYRYNAGSGFALVKDIKPGQQGGIIYNVTKAGGSVAFVYQDTLKKQNQLWATTGTANGTILIKTNTDYSAFFSDLIYNNGLLYFTSNTTAYGNELWKTAGTAASTTLVKDIYAGATSALPYYFTPLKTGLYFSAAAKNSGFELWKSEGNAAGTNMVKEINSTSTSFSGPSFYGTSAFGGNAGSATGNTLFFTATKPETGYELYQSNGSNTGTLLAKDIVPGESASNPQLFSSKNGYVYFTATIFDSNNIYTNNLFKADSNGSVTKIATAVESSINSYSVADNGFVFYIVNKYPAIQLWRTDGTLAGNVKLSDSVATNIYPFAAVTVNNKVFFAATDAVHGTELWVSNGTTAGTWLVKDIVPGDGSSNPYSFYPYNGDIYFGANDGSGTALWKSNGTTAGTVKLKAVTPYSSFDYANYFCVANNTLYFNAAAAASGAELWKTDGTGAGTRLVKDIAGGTDGSNPSYLTNVNGSVYFLAYNQQLWKSNGSSAGTVLIKDISGSTYFAFSERVVAAGKFFFNKDQLLWVSDGTDVGTQPVNDAGLNGVSIVTNMAVANNTLFFNGYSARYSYELYAGNASKVSAASGFSKAVNKPQTFTATVLQNPLQSTLKLNITSVKTQVINITVSNVQGTVLATKKLNAIKGTNTAMIDAPGWLNGVYVIHITGDDGAAVSLQAVK